ncbi:MAG: DNA repair protein RecO C-terminal domain-containing protein [Planctomycetota bacterium]
MPILKDIAQVLRVFEQGNTSLVVVLLGHRLGQFRIHAKGVRRWSKKGFEGGLDLLTRGEILVYSRHGEGLWILREWDERVRPRLGKNLELLRAASYLCEFAEALTRPTAGSIVELAAAPAGERSNAQLYDLLASATDALAKGNTIGLVLLSFTLGALQTGGLLPDFRVCSSCGRKFERDRRSIWLTSAGVRCESCHRVTRKLPIREPEERSVELSPEAHGVISHVAKTSRPVRVSANAAEQLAHALILLVHGALEHDLRTLLSAAHMVRAMGLQ